MAAAGAGHRHPRRLFYGGPSVSVRAMRIREMIHHWVSRAICALALTALSVSAQTRNDLLTGFRSVPQEAQPRVWWHWMNANITKAGIDKDLDWFKRVGVGGFMNFDGAGFVPRVVEKPLIYMT